MDNVNACHSLRGIPHGKFIHIRASADLGSSISVFIKTHIILHSLSALETARYYSTSAVALLKTSEEFYMTESLQSNSPVRTWKAVL